MGAITTATDLPPLYGLDIETDTTVDGLDSRVARIVAVAVVSDSAEWVFDDADETALLVAVDRLLESLPPGVVVTWNGGAFDLPFIAHRAALAGVATGLRLSGLERRRRDGEVRTIHRGGWHQHDHVDAYRVWRVDLPRHFQVSCSLKSVAELAGLDPVRVDVAQLHELAPADVRRYVTSDARLARELAAIRWTTAVGHVDPLAS